MSLQLFLNFSNSYSSMAIQMDQSPEVQGSRPAQELPEMQQR